MVILLAHILVFRCVVLALGLALDWRFVDPIRLLGIPHPVILLGRLINRTETVLRPSSSAVDSLPENNPIMQNPWREWLLGAIAVIFVLLCAVGVVLGFSFIGKYCAGWFIEQTIMQEMMYAPQLVQTVVLCLHVLLVFWLLAGRGLHDHVQVVTDAAQAQDFSAARLGLRALAGRDPNALDEAGVLRTAGESLAENYSDAVVGPMLAYLLFGAVGIVGYKAINSMDSMWGYKNARYRYFGWAAARLDDVVNFFPSRLSAFYLWLAATVDPAADAGKGWACLRQDARRHPSPNAGYPEAMMAGATGLCFGGPRQYAGGIVENVWLGDGRREWQAADLKRCLTLFRWAMVILFASLLDTVIIVVCSLWWVNG